MQVRMDPVVLLARALLLASVAMFLGVAGHVTAEGLLPGPAVLGLLSLVAVLPCLALLRTPAGPVRLVALLVGGQAAIHLVLSVSAGHAGDPVSASSSTAGARASLPVSLPHVEGRRVGSLQDSYETVTGTQSLVPSLPVGHLLSDLSAHAPMMLVHLLAAVGVGLWLARGERCLWTLLTLLATVVQHLVTPLVVLAGAVVLRPLRAARTDLALVPRPPHLLLARSVVRRGPPVLLAA